MMSNWTHAGASAVSAMALLAAAAGQVAQKPAQVPGTAERAPLAALWSEPEPDRDLFYGIGGSRLAPNPSDTYHVLEIKLRGYSEGYTVSDATEREWSVKLPSEATTEVVATLLEPYALHRLREVQALLRLAEGHGDALPTTR